MGYAAAMSVVMFVVSLVLACAVFRWARGWVFYGGGGRLMATTDLADSPRPPPSAVVRSAPLGPAHPDAARSCRGSS